MAQVSFRVDDKIKVKAEQACEDMGINMTTALTIFLVKLGNERRIPFEVSADPDPFYSNENMARLKAAVADAKAGRNMTEHELIED